MRKILLLLMLFITTSAAQAIDWVMVKTPLGKTAYIDKDSIIESEGYYFYNIKAFNDSTNDYTIITIQSNVSKPFSARIKTYSPEQYDSLNGDYSNITSNMTKNLEPVTYQSVVNSCYKKVKSILSKDCIEINF